MPSSALDSAIFGDLFGTAAMRAIFEDKALVQRFLDVEAALAKAQARIGIIPPKAADEIVAKARVEHIDFEAYVKGVNQVAFPIVPLVKQLVSLADDGLGEYSHWGATTQDIVDTARVLQLRDAFVIIEAELVQISENLMHLANEHKETPMIGRSFMQQALPITFGYKAAVWLSMIQRHQERLVQLLPRLLVGQFSGAVGTLASLGEDGLAVQEAFCAELGLAQPIIAWHTARDSMTEAICYLGLLTSSLSKIATDMLYMAQSEVGEVSEPALGGRGTSSTMPHKRNPVSVQLILAASRIIRQHVGGMLDASIQDHERGSGTWMSEWAIVPDAFILTAGVLQQTVMVTGGLQIHPDRMLENLNLTDGLLLSEAVMMGLAPRMGRQQAHHLVQQASFQALEEQKPLLDTLLSIREITAIATKDELESWLEPMNYVGLARQMVERVVGE